MTRFARACIAALYAPFARRRINTSPTSAIAKGTITAASSAPARTSAPFDHAASHSTGRDSARPASCSPITPRSTAAPTPTVRTGAILRRPGAAVWLCLMPGVRAGFHCGQLVLVSPEGPPLFVDPATGAARQLGHA